MARSAEKLSFSLNHRRGTLVTFLILMALVIIPFLLMIAPYFMALLVGMILAVLCQPVYRRFRERGTGPRTSSAIVTFGLLVLVLAPLTFFVITAVQQTIALVGKLSENELFSYRGLTESILNWGPIREVVGNPADVQRQLRETSTNIVRSGSTLVLNFAALIPDILLQLVLALFASFFFLIDGRNFFEWVADKIPISRNIRQIMFDSFRNTAVSVILATVAAAGVQAIMMLLTFALLRVPGAFLAAGATFIFAWIPVVGSLPVWLAGALYLYLNDSLIKMVIMLAAGVLTSIVDNIVRPWVLKGRDEMHPLVSLVAIFGGIAMFGIIGVFVGPILASLVISVMNTWPAVARQAGITVGDNVDEVEGLPVPPNVSPDPEVSTPV